MKKLTYLGLLLALLLFIPFTAQAATCAVTDVTVEGSASDVCAGPIAGNDSADVINAAFGADESVIWTLADKSDEAGTNITVPEATSGDWTYTGPTISSPFVIVLKGSTNYSAYLFKTLGDLVNGDEGTFLISFLNNGGQTPELSHMSIYTTDSDIPDTSIFGNPVPLPAALWLFGPALLGFMGLRKKVKS
jgi:hypothetical protein|tara:strand:- start:453 stop:1025 length:573 start_codon:yes stop_codon:yes gene_type:complete